MACSSACDVPTTSLSHRATSGGHDESYGAIPEKRYLLGHPHEACTTPGTYILRKCWQKCLVSVIKHKQQQFYMLPFHHAFQVGFR